MIEWRVSKTLVPYEEAVQQMEARVEAIHLGQVSECIWLLEHPPLYTMGTSARPQDAQAAPFPVHETGRGGQVTYHGPGQRIAYVMLDLRKRGSDLHAFVRDLERWVIVTLKEFGVQSECRKDRVGVWVPREDGREDKIAAIGIRVRRWVTFHGLALNIAPDLSHFKHIIPCGISDARYGVTSLKDLGSHASMEEVDEVLRHKFDEMFR